MTVDAQAAAMAIGWSIEVLTADSNREIAASFASIAQKRVDALLIGPSPLFVSRRAQIATLAARHALPVTPNTGNGCEENGTENATIAICDIRAGEEITCNYFDFDGEAHEKMEG